MLFSKVIGSPQPDWPASFSQPGFCFYDGQNDDGHMLDELNNFLENGDPPIVFTLGSAAVLDSRDFFDQSAAAAKKLGKRAVLLYGSFGSQPKGLTDDIVGFEYAPYSLVFPKAACVVHQGGVGTTGQVLRAGVPNLFMPYGHDQPDNAARCRRIGVAEIISRDKYNSETVSAILEHILSNNSYAKRALELCSVVRLEGGESAAADAIESILV
jgi:UDP:flavonoid glycosyltransferase YjiC (YdhE family)